MHEAMYMLVTCIFMFLKVNSDTSVDVFSYGVILFQLLTHEELGVESVDLTETFTAGKVSYHENSYTVEAASTVHTCIHSSQLVLMLSVILCLVIVHPTWRPS